MSSLLSPVSSSFTPGIAGQSLVNTNTNTNTSIDSNYESLSDIARFKRSQSRVKI